MGPPLILDGDGLDALSEQLPPERLRALLAEAWRRDSDVLVPALVAAECCRGAARTRAVESALSRHRSARARRPVARVIATDLDLARRVGAVLRAAGAGSADIVDAHAVALAAASGGGIVVTADPDDIERLAAAVPSVRVVVRSARRSSPTHRGGTSDGSRVAADVSHRNAREAALGDLRAGIENEAFSPVPLLEWAERRDADAPPEADA